MTVLNLLSGAGLTEGAKNPSIKGYSGDNGAPDSTAETGSLEAALAFAAALLAEEGGNDLPVDGNTLPDTTGATDVRGDADLSARDSRTTSAGLTDSNSVLLTQTTLDADEAPIPGNTVAAGIATIPDRVPASFSNDVWRPDTVEGRESTIRTGNAPAVLSSRVLAGLSGPAADSDAATLSLFENTATTSPDLRLANNSEALRTGSVPGTASLARSANAASLRRQLSANQTPPTTIAAAGSVTSAPESLASLADLIPFGESMRASPQIQAALANLARTSNGRTAITDALPSGDIRQTTSIGLTPLTPTEIAESVRLPLQGQASVAISQPIGSAGWGEQFSQKVGWVIRAGLPSATISLNPDHLGPIEMTVDVEDGLARVQFGALHATTREAIEQSLPRLREALEQQGVTLQEADVGGFSRDQRAMERHQDDAEHQIPTATDGVPAEETDVLAVTELPQSRGLIDTFV